MSFQNIVLGNYLHVIDRYFPKLYKQIIESYMVFGGIPYYLNYLRPSLSLAQNIDLLFFKENSSLKHEYTQLFSSLYKNTENYTAIVTELSRSGYGLTRVELSGKEHIVSGKELTKCLENLEQCGFIRKYQDFTKKVPALSIS